jgi:hypothetical protein
VGQFDKLTTTKYAIATFSGKKHIQWKEEGAFNVNRAASICLIFLAVGFILPVMSAAQEDTAVVTGRVTDPSQAAIAGASVEVANFCPAATAD